MSDPRSRVGETDDLRRALATERARLKALIEALKTLERHSIYDATLGEEIVVLASELAAALTARDADPTP